MSTNARYILHYLSLDYKHPTPMELDTDFLEKTFGGKVETIGDGCDLYYDKPKHKLSNDLDIRKHQ